MSSSEISYKHYEVYIIAKFNVNKSLNEMKKNIKKEKIKNCVSILNFE